VYDVVVVPVPLQSVATSLAVASVLRLLFLSNA
jgi:hypothetical protein